ncbi:MAG TPA: hypothetical protein VKB26_14935 [Candidatus Acidoferrales bacterium]|nr:hypothetical protein [Candidatus Acidoferrales bacterium]
MTIDNQDPAVIPLDNRMHTRRRAPRLNSRVPVAIEWRDGLMNRECQAEARTRVVNFYGCLLVAERPMVKEQKLVLTNLTTRQKIGGTVVFRGNKGPEGWEMGVELTSPETDFWGVEL